MFHVSYKAWFIPSKQKCNPNLFFMTCSFSGAFIVWPAHPPPYQDHALKQERGLRLCILYHAQAAKKSVECGYV